MKDIAFGFSRSSDPWKIGSLILQWCMGKKFSHTYLKFKEDAYVDSTISEETGDGCGYISEVRFLTMNTVVREFHVKISDDLFAKIMLDCHNTAGVKYGYLQNVGIGLVRLAALVGIKIKKNPLPDGMNCSEWMYYILCEIYGKWTDEDPALVGPDDVYAFLETKDLT